MRWPVRPLMGLIAGLLVLTGCGFSGGGGTGFISGDGLISRLPVGQRQQVGTVRGTLLTGESFDLASLRGKVVVINVWGSWCVPCRTEAPKLATAARRLASSGVVFLGIDTRDPSPDNGLAFDRSFGIPYPSLYDYGGQTLLAFHGRIMPNSIPSTIVVDRQGRIAASVIGSVTTSLTLEELVQDVIHGKPAA